MIEDAVKKGEARIKHRKKNTTIQDLEYDDEYLGHSSSSSSKSLEEEDGMSLTESKDEQKRFSKIKLKKKEIKELGYQEL